MKTEKLKRWAELLLDTGKRNNLINFHEVKAGTVEIVLPDFSALLERAEHSAKFEVFDPKIEGAEDEVYGFERIDPYKLSRDGYISAYGGKLRKSGQILIYNAWYNPVKVLRNIAKKANAAIEETGVNIAYIAFGFINWRESDTSPAMKAPVLLAPIKIENASAARPYYLTVSDEIVVNPAFSFKMKSEFGFALPEYDEDETVEVYLAKISALTAVAGWKVTTECRISVFSFQKINMHEDIKENTEKILKNPNVRALLGETAAIGSNADARLKALGADGFIGLHNVVDADSSQSEAIELARRGVSFVLQGPPGTGKSQTITNIIAECLANGKKVLFVSEKLAALNVVYEKLKKAGFEEFCMQLHSHKANRRDFTAELCRTLKLRKSTVSENAKRELDSLLSAKRKLDGYTRELHRKRPVINDSLYGLYERLSECASFESTDFVISEIRSKGEEYISEAEKYLSRYAEYVPSVGYDYRKNVWFGYGVKDCTYESSIRTAADLKTVSELLKTLGDITGFLREKYGLEATSISSVLKLNEFLRFISRAEYFSPAMLKADLPSLKETVENLKQLSGEILKLRFTLDGAFGEEIYSLDGKEMHEKLTARFGGALPRVFSAEYKRMIRALTACKRDKKTVKYPLAVSAAKDLAAYSETLEKFENKAEEIKEYLSPAFRGVNSDFDALSREIRLFADIRLTRKNFGILPEVKKEEYPQITRELTRINDRLDKAFRTAERSLERISSDFLKTLYNVKEQPIDKLSEKISGCIDNFAMLENWCGFYRLLLKLNRLELLKFIHHAISRKIPANRFSAVFKKAFYTQWTDVIWHESPTVMNLSRVPHDEAVKAFKEKDELTFEINKAVIKAKLSALRPSADMVAQGSAMAILLREGERKRKQKGIRTLIGETGELIQTLKPCFLMSPLSVSTYLGADTLFDVVVFDEASQIFPQDALGAIYRGKQLIVVGDSKQMPPTDFFTAVAESEEDENAPEDVSDFESVLDLCSAAFPQRRLKWHYRSRYEQLIAFSNKNFYDGDLVTFPSPVLKGEGIGVESFYVNGCFDRATKTNRAEAEKVVELVFENIRKYPERSLGVVAFGIAQQNLIDRLITKRREADTSYEYFFRPDAPEPFIVKNLETVQGDERDTVIFSIGYAKDASGKLLMNFGPLNREGGERRLNVAVTRAKKNVRLVTSMRYGDIDLTRTNSEGARLLREYLKYAAQGETLAPAPAPAVINAFEREESYLEKEIFGFLTAKGYGAKTKLGSSACKIDIAVKANGAENYSVAVECDGKNYGAYLSTRDRDRLRGQILENMGWKYYRVWSTDWIRNPAVEKERLIAAIDGANPLDGANNQPAPPPFPSKSSGFEEFAAEKKFEFPKYTIVNAEEVARQYDFGFFETVLSILETEAPLSEEWLLKRIPVLFGRKKVTAPVREGFLARMSGAEKFGIERRGGFLYLAGKEIPVLRVPENLNGEIRDIEYICAEELALGIKELLRLNRSAEKNGLFRLLLNQLGHTRADDASVEKLEEALALLNGEIEIRGDIISLK